MFGWLTWQTLLSFRDPLRIRLRLHGTIECSHHRREFRLKARGSHHGGHRDRLGGRGCHGSGPGWAYLRSNRKLFFGLSFVWNGRCHLGLRHGLLPETCGLSVTKRSSGLVHQVTNSVTNLFPQDFVLPSAMSPSAVSSGPNGSGRMEGAIAQV